MTALDDLITQTSSAISNLQKAESIRTSTAKRFSPSGSFQANFNELTSRLGILQKAKSQETTLQFTEEARGLIETDPEPIPQVQETQNNKSLIIPVLVLVGVFLLLS